MAQVEAAVGLSVGIRWEPVATAVNGTVVARPVRRTFVGPGVWHQLDRRVRLDPGDAGLVGKGRQARGSPRV
jgi:hypothetical protein